MGGSVAIEESASELTVMQEAFAREFIVDLSGTKAALRAGSTTKNAAAYASRALKHPTVLNLIRQLMDERANQVRVTAEWVLRELMEEAYRARARNDHASAIQAFTTVGKHLGMFTERLEIDVRQVQAMSDEQIEAECHRLRLVG